MKGKAMPFAKTIAFTATLAALIPLQILLVHLEHPYAVWLWCRMFQLCGAH